MGLTSTQDVGHRADAPADVDTNEIEALKQQVELAAFLKVLTQQTGWKWFEAQLHQKGQTALMALVKCKADELPKLQAKAEFTDEILRIVPTEMELGKQAQERLEQIAQQQEDEENG